MKSIWGHTSESLELVPCKEFMGPPGSGAALAQPFEVTMQGQVSLCISYDLHLGRSCKSSSVEACLRKRFLKGCH